MSHPDPCYDPDNSLEDDMYYDDYDTFEDMVNDADDSMDGDHDSAMTSCGWGTDEDYGYYGDCDDFHSDEGYEYYDDGE